MPFGQVRGNLFVQLPWQLREWRISQSADGAPTFTPVTVKTNPFPPFYGVNTAGEDAEIKALRTQFKAAFAGTRVPELVTVDQGGIVGTPEAPIDLFFQLGAAFPNRFNAFESQSQGTKDDPNTIATSDLKTKITQRLNQIGVASACELTAEHVLNRAGALSCGGCHQFTVDKPVATGVNWPALPDSSTLMSRGTCRLHLSNFFFLLANKISRAMPSRRLRRRHPQHLPLPRRP